VLSCTILHYTTPYTYFFLCVYVPALCVCVCTHVLCFVRPVCVYVNSFFLSFSLSLSLSLGLELELGSVPLRVGVKVPTSNPMAHRIVLWCSGKIYISGVNGIQQYALNDLHVPVFRTAASWGESGGSRVPWQPLSV